MNNIILIGAGGHSKSCIDVIESTGSYIIKGLIDLKEKIGERVLGYPIIDYDDNIAKYVNDKTFFLITLGQIKSAERRKELFNNLKNLNAKIATIISPYAYISKYAKIDEGTIIMHFAFLNAGVVVGKNCIINTNAHLEHDVKVGSNCHLSTSCVVNGDCLIGNEVFVGSNATVIQGSIIQNNSFIKAGSLYK